MPRFTFQATTSVWPRRAAMAALSLTLIAVAGPAMAEAKYPSKPVTLIVPFPPGSATDALLRAMAPVLGKAQGQTVLIDNKPGAAGTMGAALLAQSKQADGYLLSVVPATLFKVPHLQKVAFNPMTDFSYVTAFTSYSYGIAVKGDSPYTTLKAFLDASKASAKPFSVGSTGTGGSGHTAAVLLAKQSGANFEYVPFKGGADGLTAFMGGHIDAICEGQWAQTVRQHKARALVTFSEKRLMPDVPTARELGYDIVTYSPVGLIGPKGMDPKAMQTLQDAVKLAMQDASVRKVLETYDMGDTFMTGDEYRKVGERLWVEERKNLEMVGLIEASKLK